MYVYNVKLFPRDSETLYTSTISFKAENDVKAKEITCKVALTIYPNDMFTSKLVSKVRCER